MRAIHFKRSNEYALLRQRGVSIIEIYVRPYHIEDAEALLACAVKNKSRWERWMPIKPDAESYTLGGQQARILEIMERSSKDEHHAFGIFLKEDDSLIGEVSVSFVMRGPAETCMIGYQIDADHGGRGLMAQAIRLVLQILFDGLGFHRIRAEVMPENLPSARVLEKIGFVREGLARKSLYINGDWEDFVLFALLKEEYEWRR
ncbi:GNAT family N-acetyltransferase [Exiguobacterium flavidum]|uniref:GNAT family N-acetyltransferase n=1 Tax=Exiguobacterium flavidum TaxID=2184695 RepID=UPI001E4D8B9F|nr:GNAT family protein [Exiguobacterium flavidum]